MYGPSHNKSIAWKRYYDRNKSLNFKKWCDFSPSFYLYYENHKLIK